MYFYSYKYVVNEGNELDHHFPVIIKKSNNFHKNMWYTSSNNVENAGMYPLSNAH